MGVAINRPVRGIDLVESPDDGGFYLQSYDTATGEEKVSVTYPTRSAAIDAMRRNSVEWEEGAS
jgi:hypothetical protein